MSNRRQALWRRQIMPFLLVCLAGGAAAVLQANGRGLNLPPTGQLVLGAAIVFCLWGLWRWRRMLPLLPTPPWQAAIQALARRQLRTDPATRAIRRQLVGVQLRARLQPPPAQPRPIAPPRPVRRRRLGTAPGRRRSRLASRVRLPLPAIDIQFVAPGTARTVVFDAHQVQTGVATVLTDLLAQLIEMPPELLALHDQPRNLVCQLAPTPLLTAGQQREITQALQVHGISSQWSDLTLLALRREQLHAALPAHPDRPLERLWLPVVRTRLGSIWWPLARRQHMVLAGAMHGPLTGLVERLGRLPAAQRPALLIHDPDGRLRELNDTLAALAPQEDALAQARHAQLTRRFARERGRREAALPPPLLLVMTPSAAIWPDLQPLLAPDSGVQVVLILGDRAPIGALRAACHRLPVIEVPDPRYPALPDAFRPAGLPAVGVGQAIAWLPGGQTVWRGMPPAIEAQPAHAMEEERPQ